MTCSKSQRFDCSPLLFFVFSWISPPNALFIRVGKNFRLLIQSCRFFPPDFFMKISNFSKTVDTIFIKFCIVILHPKGPLRAASKLYDWNVRNIAKISPKMAKNSPKTAVFRLLLISQKLFIRFERNCVQSFYTILWSFVSFFNFFRFSQNCPYNSNENFYSHFLHHSMVYVCNFNKSV